MISVVITCYNYARYVASAIESVLQQSYPNKELIVVNDGSTDASAAIIAGYGERVQFIDQPNQGSIAAYNRGFAASKGEIVIFLDADDLLEKNTLAEVAAAWTAACAKVQYDLAIIDADGRSLGRKFCHFDTSYDAARVRSSFKRTATYRWPVTVGNAYSRWFAEQLFPLRIEHGPDGTLNTLAPLYGDVVTIPRVLGRYRLHGKNRWSTAGSDLKRLPTRIEHRLTELATLEQHALRRGAALPQGSALDHEIAFINYRLMAKKLGLHYPGDASDTSARLLGMVYEVLFAEKYPFKVSLSHALWFTLLCISPGPVARGLITLRFRRDELAEPYRKARERLATVVRGRSARAIPAATEAPR